jgi:hypothetical protein
MALKPGELADEIEHAFESVWGQLKPDDPFPSDGRADRRVLFLAVARGLLTYLENKQNETLSTLQLVLSHNIPDTYIVEALDLNIDLS